MKTELMYDLISVSGNHGRYQKIMSAMTFLLGYQTNFLISDYHF